MAEHSLVQQLQELEGHALAVKSTVAAIKSSLQLIATKFTAVDEELPKKIREAWTQRRTLEEQDQRLMSLRESLNLESENNNIKLANVRKRISDLDLMMKKEFEEHKEWMKGMDEEAKQFESELSSFEDSESSETHKEFEIYVQRLNAVRQECQEIEERIQEVGKKQQILERNAANLGANLKRFLMQNKHRSESVLSDVVQYFIHQHLNPPQLILHTVKEFKKSHVVEARKLCIMMLETIAFHTPSIRPELKEDARKVADELKKELNDEYDRVLEFLLLVGTYRLAAGFRPEMLKHYLQIVAQYEKATELQQLLSLQEKKQDVQILKFRVWDVVKKLIRPEWEAGEITKNQHEELGEKLVHKLVDFAIKTESQLETKDEIDRYLSLKEKDIEKYVKDQICNYKRQC